MRVAALHANEQKKKEDRKTPKGGMREANIFNDSVSIYICIEGVVLPIYCRDIIHSSII